MSTTSCMNAEFQGNKDSAEPSLNVSEESAGGRSASWSLTYMDITGHIPYGTTHPVSHQNSHTNISRTGISAAANPQCRPKIAEFWFVPADRGVANMQLWPRTTNRRSNLVYEITERSQTISC